MPETLPSPALTDESARTTRQEVQVTVAQPALPPRTTGAGSMASRWSGRVLAVLSVVALVAGGAWAFHIQQDKTAKPPQTTQKVVAPKGGRVEFLGENALGVPPEVVSSLGIKTALAKAATQPQVLPPLQGTLAIDNNRLARVHSPFAGIVVALGTPEKGETERPTGEGGPRGLRVGDRVEAGQLLAVVWSQTLGEKKSELVDAVSRLRVDRDTLARLKGLTDGIVPRKQVTEAEAAVRASENAVAKAQDTLRAWRLPEAEIQAIVTEAQRLGSGQARRDLTAGKTWARVEVRAPFAGAVLEKNTNVGDVVDTAADLFRVADLSRLTVWAQVYEDDLPALQELKKSGQSIPWEVRLPSRPHFRSVGRLDQIGEIIDPVQHTALVSGTVDNPAQELKVGQFVTVTVAVPPKSGEVEIPTAALIEDGKASVVFVQPDPSVTRFVRRTVTVSRRYHDVVYLSGEGLAGETVVPGDPVVVGGALQLNQALTDAPGAATAAR